MKITIILATALLSTSLFANALPANKCKFYEHFDYKGKSFMLHTGHVLTVNSSFKVGADFTNGSDSQRFTAPEWQGKLSSNQVAKGCKAIIVTANENVWVGDTPRYSGNYNDKVIAVGCRCN